MLIRDGVSSVPTIEQFFGCRRDHDRGCGRGRDFGGCGFFEGDEAHMVVDRVALIKDNVNTDIVRGIITFLRSTRRNLVALNRHMWLI